MNIDYAAIIEKADMRRMALQAMERLLRQAPSETEKLLGLIEYTQQLITAWKTLDSEGHGMFSETIQRCMLEFQSSTNLNQAYFLNRGFGDSGFHTLAEEVSK
jgi:hypothetical protein